MLNLYKHFSLQNTDINIEKYKDEFEDIRLTTNIQRCEKLVSMLLILDIALIIIDFIVYKPMRTISISYLYLFYSHIAVLILVLFWFSLLQLYRRYNKILLGKFLYHSFVNIILYWGVFMSLNNLYISGQITAYIICVLSISVCFYITNLEAVLSYFISLVIFSIGLIFIVHNKNLLYSHLVNVSTVALISFVISKLNLISFSKEFAFNKSLLESKLDLEKTNKKLKDYEKVRTDFFANISHELKTPLNVIFCAEQMIDVTMKKNQYNDSNMNKYLKMIKQNSYRLTRLIGNLIDITKIDALSFDVKLINTDIINVVEDITMSVAAFVENKGISFTFDTDVEEKIICCDPNQIERIILNLLSNAVKFTDKGGSIFVYVYMQDNKVCISIKDTGIGIPNHMKDSIFDRFIQVDKSASKNSEGSGIGLALVKSLVEMHGGSINVNSTLGKGSEFIVMLPDTVLTENKPVEDSSNIEEDCVKKICIEFSDIYD